MNDLGFKLIVDTRTKRRVFILKNLIVSGTPLALKTIASLSDTSIRTIQTDINYLIEKYPNDIQLTTFNHNLSLQKLSTNIVLENHIETLQKNTPLIPIIEAIFNGEKQGLSDYADMLFLTESSLKNYLNILKKILLEYELSVTFTPLEIIGPEINIRIFYFHYFRYTKGYAPPIFGDTTYTFIFNTIQTLKETYGLVLNVDYYRVATYYFIWKKRLENNHLIYIEDRILKKYQIKSSYIKFKNALLEHFHEQKLRNNLTEHELMFSYLIRLDTIVYESDTSFFTDDFYTDFKESENLVTEYFLDSNMAISLNLALKDFIQAYIANIDARIDLSPLFQKSPSTLKKIAEKNHPVTFNTWLNILKQHKKYMNSYDIASNLTLLTQANLVSKKHILFALTGEPVSLGYYKKVAQNNIPPYMKVSFIFNSPVTNEQLEQMNIDFFIYNFKQLARLNNVLHLEISTIPSDFDWGKIRDMLHN